MAPYRWRTLALGIVSLFKNIRPSSLPAGRVPSAEVSQPCAYPNWESFGDTLHAGVPLFSTLRAQFRGCDRARTADRPAAGQGSADTRLAHVGPFSIGLWIIGNCDGEARDRWRIINMRGQSGIKAEVKRHERAILQCLAVFLQNSWLSC
jgi:hypothetical protein